MKNKTKNNVITHDNGQTGKGEALIAHVIQLREVYGPEEHFANACAKVEMLHRQLKQAEQEQWNAYVETEEFSWGNLRRHDWNTYWNEDFL